MQTNILPKELATNLMPTYDDGKPIVTFISAEPYVNAAVHYLQEQRISLNTADFVDAIMQSLEIDVRDLIESGLVHALYKALIIKHYSMTILEQELYRDIVDWLHEQDFSDETFRYYKAIVTADYPMASTINPRKIAVWRSTSKMGDWDKRQAVSVRKWIGSTLTHLTSEQAESLAKRIDERLASLIELDIRHHSSYEFDAWERAYSSDKIRSCMNTNSGHEVGSARTFTCYCSGYHDLPDNGLNLTVLYQGDTPVSRAITFSDDEQKYYIRSYGDDRLDKWLGDNGYEQGDFLEGTLLYTTERLIKPYVDGLDVMYSDRYTTHDGKHYWSLNTYGDYHLQTTDAYATNPTKCDCCGENFHGEATQEVCSAVDGGYYTVCDDCLDNNSYWVYTGYEAERVFFHDGCSPISNAEYVEYDNEYYETSELSRYDLRNIDGEVYRVEDLYYCEKTYVYFIDYEEVYTDAEQISTTQPVHFPYDCISKEYWDNNVVECACGTLALSDDAQELSTPSLGEVRTLDDYWKVYVRYDGAGASLAGTIFKLDDIERDYDYEPTEKMKAFRDYAIAYNTIQYLRFQELGI